MLSLESYSKTIDESYELFLNVVELATTANSVITNQTLIVQTTLKKVIMLFELTACGGNKYDEAIDKVINQEKKSLKEIDADNEDFTSDLGL